MAGFAGKLFFFILLIPTSAVCQNADAACTSPSDNAALLQTRGNNSFGESLHQMSKASSLKSCLSFIHIPKNMGGSIENSLIKAYKFKASPDSASCALRARSSNIKERLWGVCDDKIRCSRSSDWPWQEGHAWPGCAVPPNAPRSIPESIRRFAGKTPCSPWHCQTSCSPFHFPPAFDPTLAASYTKDCDSFCVIRDPMHRYLSQLRRVRPMKDVCDPQKLEQLTRKVLNTMDFKWDCHLIPQVYHVYQDGEPTSPRICHHILKYESMSSEFPALMGKYGLKVNLTQQYTHRGLHCNVTPTRATVRMVASFYSKDYKAFGFAARQAMVALQDESE